MSYKAASSVAGESHINL